MGGTLCKIGSPLLSFLLCSLCTPLQVLLIVRENQLEIEGKNICPLNQQEIASLVPCGKLKVNQIIRELVEEGYVEMVHAKGRYFITNKGYELLEKMSLDEK